MLIHFCIYGLLGWCLEVVWTALYNIFWPEGGVRDYRLVGKTYLWMFPIYGAAGLLFEPIHELIRPLWWPGRGFLWMLLCFLIEYSAGWLLKKLIGRCPWDYSYSQWNVHGFIRLDYAPLWFGVGLLFERIHDFIEGIF